MYSVAIMQAVTCHIVFLFFTFSNVPYISADDECISGLHNCDANASYTITQDGYDCACMSCLLGNRTFAKVRDYVLCLIAI